MSRNHHWNSKRASMKLEKRVMKALYKAQLNDPSPSKLRFRRISEISGVKVPTLQRVLQRLQKRGWIERKEYRIYHVLEVPNAAARLPDLNILIDALDLPKDVVMLDPYLQREYVKALEQHRIQKMVRYFTGKRNMKNPYPVYRRIINQQSSVQRLNALRISKQSDKEKSTVWEKLIHKLQDRMSEEKFSYYRVIAFPFLHPSPAQPDDQWNTPKGTKRFWKKAAKELAKEIKRP